MEIYTSYEKKLIDLLGYFLLIDNGKYFILNDVGDKIGTIEEKEIDGQKYSHMRIKDKNFEYDSKRNVKDFGLENYEFIIKDEKYGIVNVCLTLGDTRKIGFMDDKGEVRSLSISDNILLLTYSKSYNDNSICEQVIVKRDSKSDFKSYFGTSYNYQIAYESKNNSDEAFISFDLDPLKQNEVILTAKYPKKSLKEEIHFKKSITIREAILKDKKGLEVFNKFRNYANAILPFDFDIMKILLGNIKIKNDVFSLFYKDLLANEINLDKSIVINLANNCLFTLTIDNDYNRSRARVYGTIIRDLKDCYSFGYVESDNQGEFILNDSNYIFRLNSNGDIDRVYDFINGIEVEDESLKEEIYSKYKESKKLSK